MSKKILIVDDEPDQVFTVKKALEKIDGDYEIVSANSGMECLEILKNDNIPDLILLDIMMPEMSGWIVYDRIKDNEKWEKIPIIFLTARTDRVAENAGKFLGDDFIEKPFDRDDLKKRIDLILKSIVTVESIEEIVKEDKENQEE